MCCKAFVVICQVSDPLNSLNPHFTCAFIKNERPQTPIQHFTYLFVQKSPASRDFVTFQVPKKYENLNPATCCTSASGICMPIRRFLPCIMDQSLNCTLLPSLVVFFSQHVYKYIHIYCYAVTFIYRTISISELRKFVYSQQEMSVLIKIMNEMKGQGLLMYNLLGLLINANPLEKCLMAI